MREEAEHGHLQDDDILQAATQFSWSESEYTESPRPVKRQRLGPGVDARKASLDSDSDEAEAFDPPVARKSPIRSRHASRESIQASIPDTGYGSKKAKKSIHVPKQTAELRESYFTQPPPSSDPWTIRGPIWQSKAQFAAQRDKGYTASNGNGILSSHKIENGDCIQRRPARDSHSFDGSVAKPEANSKREEPKAPEPVEKALAQSELPVIDIAQELADLPSDAFASSSSSPQKPPENNVIYVSSQTNSTIATSMRLAAPLNGLRQKTLFGDTVQQMGPQSQATKRHNWPVARKDEPHTHHKLDSEALKTWVYPTNLGTTRDYQFNITHRGLYHNLLVALPTGLGKTFIAATVMLNWFRWTTEAQIVFVAPTKPLVSQQVEACFNIAGIPRSETTMLTGGIAPGLRAEEWNSKRVFFMTPQTIINDLKTGICDPKKIVLLVVDEAHRATGGYAYVEVVKFLRRFNQSFRVLALTATPGSTVEAVQQVIDGLDIARVEIRTENSLDIRQFVHTRNTETVLFDFSEEQEMCMDMFAKALQPLVNQLNSQNAYWGKDPMSLSAYGLTKARAAWMASDAGRRAGFGLKGMVNSIITILARLAHGIELLKFHGIGSFYRVVSAFRDDTQSSKYQRQVNENEHFKKMMARVRGWINNDQFIGHPKIDYLQNVVLEHFTNASEGRNSHHGKPPSSTRIMIFAHYRDSAEEIVRVLKRHEPMIRPHVFVGQAASKGTEGMDQKHQLKVIEQFKTGVHNTLVATSIGEEGLDIGEVDLIICYDSSSSPIRMLQRMGRTGRKRQGNIVLLLMRGKEENSFNQAKDNYEQMQSMIASGTRFDFHEDRSPRIVPKEIQPTVDKRLVEIPLENTQGVLPEPRRRGRIPKRPPKKFHMPDGVRTGFVRASHVEGDEDEDLEPSSLRATLKPQTLEDEEQISNPPLSDVILGPAEEKELQRKYTYVCGGDDENVAVEPPRLDAFPQYQRSLRPSKRLQHSSKSERLARALAKMHELNETKIMKLKTGPRWSDIEPDFPDSDLALESDSEPTYLPQTAFNSHQHAPEVPRKRNSPQISRRSCHAPPKQPRRSRPKPKKSNRRFEVGDDDMDAPSSSAPQSSARMRLPSQAVDLGSYDTSDDDAPEGEPSSELREFVVDDDEVEEDGESDEKDEDEEEDELPTISQAMGNKGRGPAREEVALESESEPDLPEVDSLVQTRLTDPELRMNGSGSGLLGVNG
ncbi:P-loop containing nucleoside triphosphate hydrolase protein, partial [Viridothelium virens]